MKPVTRRSVMVGSAAAVTALPALALPVAAREADMTERVRAFARELLTVKTDPLTAGEWVERKRIAGVLLVLIGDKPEPWKPWELQTITEIDRKRVAPIWRAGHE